MDTEKKTNLKLWLENLTVLDYKETQRRIITECKVSHQVLRHWKCGNSEPSTLAKGIINDIAGKEIYAIEK